LNGLSHYTLWFDNGDDIYDIDNEYNDVNASNDVTYSNDDDDDEVSILYQSMSCARTCASLMNIFVKQKYLHRGNGKH
jgi:hypothetical protein